MRWRMSIPPRLRCPALRAGSRLRFPSRLGCCAQPRTASRVFWASIFFGLVGLAAATAAEADTVRLKDGRTIEGEVVRKDAAQVVILTGSQAQVVSTGDVDAFAYSRARLTPSTMPIAEAPWSQEPVRLDYTLLGQAAARLRTVHRLARRIRQIGEHLREHDDQEAAQEAQRTLEGLVPIHHGRFSPLYALADLLVLLGLRAPTVWLALLLVKELRSFTRVAEFLTIAYGLTMLLATWALGVASLWVKLLVLPLALGGVAGLFAWMFALQFRWAVLAFLLTAGMNLGIERLLVSTHVI